MRFDVVVTQNFVHLKSKKAVCLFAEQNLTRRYRHISTSLEGVCCQFIPKILTIGSTLQVVCSYGRQGAAEPRLLSGLRNLHYKHENKHSRLVSMCTKPHIPEQPARFKGLRYSSYLRAAQITTSPLFVHAKCIMEASGYEDG